MSDKKLAYEIKLVSLVTGESREWRITERQLRLIYRACSAYRSCPNYIRDFFRFGLR